MKSTFTSPILLVADRKSPDIFDMPGFLACGQSGETVCILHAEDLIPLPQGSNIFFLPDRHPVAFNTQAQRFEELPGFYAAAAFVPPGYTQLLTPAYREEARTHLLPLFSYAPVAFYKGGLHVPAVRVDRRKNHDLCGLDRKLLGGKIRSFSMTANRLIKHLAGCAQTHGCPNAINFFLGKYEAPLPVSPSCNATCLGCISFQKKGSCPATQPRLTFVPTPEEIAEVAVIHIKSAVNPIVSFGQGCEGEPLLRSHVIRKAIQIIRRETLRGTIHMNTNGSLTREIEALCGAGLDSLRVSLNSAQQGFYHRYYSPRGYTFADVCRSITTAKRYKKFVSLNYLVMPGFTDREDEFLAMTQLIRKTRVDMIQWRNLNYDPQRYFAKLKVSFPSCLLGVRTVIERLRRMFPALKHGYFNMPKELM